MKLRQLKEKDAPLMLEWMHDTFVVEHLQTRFSEKTLDDCMKFIHTSSESSESINLAIVDEYDEYMGTVSLKHIHGKFAEFGITVRRCAMGKGYSNFAMKEIVKMGFNDLHLDYIYWCVDPINARAVRFYDKHNYSRVDIESLEAFAFLKENKLYTDEQISKYVWYKVER